MSKSHFVTARKPNRNIYLLFSNSSKNGNSIKTTYIGNMLLSNQYHAKMSPKQLVFYLNLKAEEMSTHFREEMHLN